MSDRPDDVEFKLQHVVVAVSDVVEWFDLGLQLGLPSTTLRSIAADPNIKDIKSQRLAMLSEWLKYDTAASWDKLASALVAIGERVAAANVRSKYMKVATAESTAKPGISEDEKTCEEMKQNVLQTIKCQFASLQVEVRSAMEAQQVKMNDIHQFLVASFQGVCHIPEAPDLTKIFNIVTESKLWCYDNYIPLKKLAEKFLPDDDPVRKCITEYRSQLSGFYTTTKIIDFIDLSKLEEAEDDIKQPTFVAENYKKHYRRLTLQLKLDRKVKLSDLTLDYVDTLWKSLIEEFNLPPLTAVIDEIVGGSLIISWLVPPQVSSVIAASYSKALGFYQQHNIVQVQLDGRTLYDEDWITGDINRALINACRAGCIEKVIVLLDLGADMNYKDERGRSALHHASFAGEIECVEVLLKYGAQVDLPDDDGNTPLVDACRSDYIETARVLMDHGANVDQQNNKGETVLIWACYNEDSEIVDLLLKAGARTDIQEKGGQTALYWAACGDYANIAQILVDHGAAVDLGRNEDGMTGLIWASLRGYTETVSVLLAAKADPNITDEDGYTALHRAAAGGEVEIINLLVKHGAAVDTRNKYGDTALHEAATRDEVEAVKALVNCGAAVDIRNKYGLIAMEVAWGAGEEAICAVLEQHTTEQERSEPTEEQRESVYQRLLKMLERTFLKEQVKKREEHQKKERHRPREESVGGEREKRSLLNRLRGRQDRPGQITGTAPAPEK